MRARLIVLSLLWCACPPGIASNPDGGGGGTGGAGGTGSTGGGGTGGATGGGAPSDAGQNPALASLADNTLMDLGQFPCTDNGDGMCRQVTDYSGFTYDSRNHQFLMFGGGHATTMTDVVFEFDLDSSLSWKEPYPPTPCASMVSSNLDPATGAWLSGASGPYPRPLAAHTYDLLGFSPALNEFVLLSRMFNGGPCSQVGNDVGGPVAHYNLGTGAWSFATVSGGSNSDIEGSELDPVSGLFILFGRSGLAVYDPVNRTRSQPVSTFNGDTMKNPQGAVVDLLALGYANHLSYFPPNDTFYFFLRGAPVATYALKLNRANLPLSTVELLTTTGPTSPHGEPAYAYDSHHARLGGAVSGSTFYEFDPMTNTWTSHAMQGGTPGDEAFEALGYDPVNNVFIFITDYASGQHTWAYRLRN